MALAKVAERLLLIEKVELGELVEMVAVSCQKRVNERCCEPTGC